MSIINEAIELGRGRRNGSFFDWLDSDDWHDFSMTTEQIHAVLQREKHARAFPKDRPARLHVPFRETVFLDDPELENDDEPSALDDTNQLVPEMGQPRGKRPKRAHRDLPGQGDLF
jgi:hypothetical protein